MIKELSLTKKVCLICLAFSFFIAIIFSIGYYFLKGSKSEEKIKEEAASEQVFEYMEKFCSDGFFSSIAPPNPLESRSSFCIPPLENFEYEKKAFEESMDMALRFPDKRIYVKIGKLSGWIGTWEAFNPQIKTTSKENVLCSIFQGAVTFCTLSREDMMAKASKKLKGYIF